MQRPHHTFTIEEIRGAPPVFTIDGRPIPREIALGWLRMFLDGELRRDLQERMRRRRREVSH